MVEGGMSCIKYLIFAFNLVFFVIGAALLGLGIYVQVALREYLDFFSTNINGPAIVLIVVGLIIFVVAFFGCCGAIKENYCMVITFSILMGTILLLQVSAAIAGFAYKGKVEEKLKEEMKDSMQNYAKSGHDGVKKTWDDVQKGGLKCCGTTSPTDWQSVSGFESKPPGSCCDNGECKSYDETKTREGCYNKVKSIISDNVYYVGAVGIALAVIQVTGIVLACCLARGVRKEYEIA